MATVLKAVIDPDLISNANFPDDRQAKAVMRRICITPVKTREHAVRIQRRGLTGITDRQHALAEIDRDLAAAEIMDRRIAEKIIQQDVDELSIYQYRRRLK